MQQELVAERRAVAAVFERTAALRREEAAALSRRVHAESELRRAQQAGLASAIGEMEELRGRLVAARRSNADVKVALERHQDLLRRLCS